MDTIAVLIPCYNEEKTVQKVVSDFRAVLPQATVFVYDNNSTDHTSRLAAAAGAVVRHEYQQGKGNVLRRMFREIDAECYILVDGDDTYPAESAPEMARLVLEHQADMVVGDRLSSTYFTENKRPFHNFGNNLVRRLIRVMPEEAQRTSDMFDLLLGAVAEAEGLVISGDEYMQVMQQLSDETGVELDEVMAQVDGQLVREQMLRDKARELIVSSAKERGE